MSNETVFDQVTQAHMAGQAEAGIDPSWSNAQSYALEHEQPAPSPWISVEDRMPEESGVYFTIRTNDNCVEWASLDWYLISVDPEDPDADAFPSWEDLERGDEIIKWMEIPE